MEPCSAARAYQGRRRLEIARHPLALLEQQAETELCLDFAGPSQGQPDLEGLVVSTQQKGRETVVEIGRGNRTGGGQDEP